MKKALIKIAELLTLMVYLIGVIGGIGTVLYHGEYVIAVGILFTGVLALPAVLDIFSDLKS